MDLRCQVVRLLHYVVNAMTMYAEILKILTLSMANFHSPKLGSAIIPMNKMGKPAKVCPQHHIDDLELEKVLNRTYTWQPLQHRRDGLENSLYL